MYRSLWCSLSLSLFKGKNFKVQLFIYIFHIFVKVFTFNEFYLKNCPSDFKIIYTKKLQIFFSIFWYNLKILKLTFSIYAFLFFVKVLPLMNFISRTVHQILKSFTPKNWNFFSLFLCIFSNLKKNFFDFLFAKFC